MPATAIPAGCRQIWCRWFRTGNASAQAATAAKATAIRMPGQAGRSFLKPTMMAMLTAATATAEKLAVCSAPASACSFGTSSPGSFASVMPNRSLIWVAKMTTAMPAVNPTVTG